MKLSDLFNKRKKCINNNKNHIETQNITDQDNSELWDKTDSIFIGCQHIYGEKTNISCEVKFFPKKRSVICKITSTHENTPKFENLSVPEKIKSAAELIDFITSNKPWLVNGYKLSDTLENQINQTFMGFTCVRCKKTFSKENICFFENFSFCESCFAKENFDGFSNDERPEKIMPEILIQNLENHSVSNSDVIIKEYIPLEEKVCHVKNISENFTEDKNDKYAGEISTESICVDPITGKYYLKNERHSCNANPRPGDHSFSSCLIVREMEKSEISNDLIKEAMQKKPPQHSFMKEFPSLSKPSENIENTAKKTSDIRLPDKLYCGKEYGEEYCYLRRVNGEYRLFYIKRFNTGYNLLSTECSENFINSVFERIDSLNQYPLPKDYMKHKGNSLLFSDSMPTFACDRKLNEKECAAIKVALLNFGKETKNHKIGGFFVLFSKDDFKIVELSKTDESTIKLYNLLTTIAKYG